MRKYLLKSHKIQIIHHGVTYDSKWESDEDDLHSVKTSLKMAAKGEATFLEIENDKGDIHFFPSQVLMNSVLTVIIKKDEGEIHEPLEGIESDPSH